MFLFNLLCLAGALGALPPLRGGVHGQWYAQARDATLAEHILAKTIILIYLVYIYIYIYIYICI